MSALQGTRSRVDQDWRIELMNSSAAVRQYLYSGDWPQDEANADALSKLRSETGDPTWRTLSVWLD
jgi:hypothetical protein